MYDSINAFEVSRDVVYGHVINQNGLEFISVRGKYLSRGIDFGTTCRSKGG